jgi:hypothetical protein
VLVSVGPLPLGHLTLAGQETVLCVPSAVKTRLNDCATLELEFILLIVILVTLAFKDTRNIFPLSKFSVSDPELIDAVEVVSAYLTNA